MESHNERASIELLVESEARSLRRLRILSGLRWVWIGVALWVAMGIRNVMMYNWDPYLPTFEGTHGELGGPKKARPVPAMPFSGIVAMAATGMPLFGALRRAKASGMRAGQTVASLDSCAAIGPLSRWLGSSDRVARGLAENRLLVLLPQMRVEDSDHLTDEDHARLNRVFTTGDSSLALAVLAAWEQVGDERDLLPVQYVSEGLDIGRTNPVLREAAAQCLPFLTERAERRRTAATLLRAAETDTRNSALLRPAAESGNSAGDSLLRPSV